jgi:hypothetical protein
MVIIMTVCQDKQSYFESVLYAINVLSSYRERLKDLRGGIECKSVSPKEVELTNYLLNVEYHELVEPVMDQFFFFKNKLKRKKMGKLLREKISELETHAELVDLGLCSLEISLEGLMLENPSVFYSPDIPKQNPGETNPMFS